VLQWAEGVRRGAAFFALVLLSHTLFFGGLVFTRFGRLFYNTASAVQSRAGSGRSWFRARQNCRHSVGWLEKIVAKLSCSDRDTRALAVKDLRMFWRDTTQWGQSVMLFGLLRCLHHQPAQFHASVEQPVLGQSGFVSESRRLLAEPCLGDDAVCVPAIFAGRLAAVDHRHGADGHGARGQNQIWLASTLSLFRDLWPHHAVLLSAQNELDRVLFFGAVAPS